MAPTPPSTPVEQVIAALQVLLEAHNDGTLSEDEWEFARESYGRLQVPPDDGVDHDTFFSPLLEEDWP